jgi:uncharacterized protein (TIGR02246 family)
MMRPSNLLAWEVAMNIRAALLFILMLFVSAVMKAGAANSLSAEDIAKIRQVHNRYEETWLKGDADGVRSLFTEDCVLLPPHGDKPRIGQRGLNEFWFPPGVPPSQITKLVVTPRNIGGDGQIAYVWGTHEVEWTTTLDGKTARASHKGVFLNVLRKQADGEWKISHHMWDEPVKRN